MNSERMRALNRVFALGVLLYYPVMVVKWLPFGGGARYLGVLVPVVMALTLIAGVPRDRLVRVATDCWRWSWPLLPFVIAWTFAQILHGHVPADHNAVKRLVQGVLLYGLARHFGVTYRELAWAAVVAAVVYGVVAVVEVWVLARPRAWGGSYENRFAQFAVWMVALGWLHCFTMPKEGRTRSDSVLLALGTALGMTAVVLSGSRGAMLALGILGVVAAMRSLGWYRGSVVGLIAVGLLTLGVMAFGPMAARLELVTHEASGYFSDPEFKPTSIGLRLELIRVALTMLVEHPLVGPGETHLQALYAMHPSLGAPPPEILALPGFHSDPGQLVGLGGGLLLGGWLLSCGWLAYRARGDAFRLSFVALALMFGFSEIFFANNLGLSLFVASWALYSAAADNRESAR